MLFIRINEKTFIRMKNSSLESKIAIRYTVYRISKLF